MRHVVSIVLIFSFVLMLSGCGAISKDDIFDLVEDEYDAIVKACEQKDEEALLDIDGISQVKINDKYVLVYCKGAGIATSSQDYGFYYSEENIPVAVDCNLYIVSDVLTSEGKGYKCEFQGNYFYTEHIKGNIYFYSNAY